MKKKTVVKPKASPVSLADYDLSSLGALALDEGAALSSARGSTLAFLRASPEFGKTGRVPLAADRYGHAEGVAIAVEGRGARRRLYLTDGRHRFTVARERGLRSVWGTVRNIGSGRVVFRGNIPIARRSKCRTIGGVPHELVPRSEPCAPASSASSSRAATKSASLATRIEKAGRKLAGGPRRRVRLANLRHELRRVSRAELDAALLHLQNADRLVLYRLDNPVELTDADRVAALLVAGEPRHLVYFP